MLVCVCNGISDRDIDDALQGGATNFGDLKKELGIGNCCGQCAAFAKDMVTQKTSQMSPSTAFHLAYDLG